MADDDVARAAERKAREGAQRKIASKIAAEWRRTGHDPRAHLLGITAMGEPDVLLGFMQYAHFHVHKLGRPLTLGLWLGQRDMQEIREYARTATVGGQVNVG